MLQKLDHFTPLSRAVASIDRDSYAARFAVYDREHKALLHRLASADEPLSDADIASEEQAFRDAIRRIEFADDDEPTLVPQDEPIEAPLPPAPRRPPVWPQVRPPRREAADASVSPGLDEVAPVSAVEPLVESSARRSVVRRVGERLALAVIALALVGGGLWMLGGRLDDARNPSSSRSAAESAEPAPDNAADAKAQQPSWYSPQMFYVPPPTPVAPRADVPLPVPRPER